MTNTLGITTIRIATLVYIYIRSYRGPLRGERLVKDADGDGLSTRPRERVDEARKIVYRHCRSTTIVEIPRHLAAVR